MSDTTFGDFDEADAWADERPDPEQVARKLHTLAAAAAVLGGRPVPRWEALDSDERQVAIDLIVILLRWLQRQGALREMG